MKQNLIFILFVCFLLIVGGFIIWEKTSLFRNKIKDKILVFTSGLISDRSLKVALKINFPEKVYLEVTHFQPFDNGIFLEKKDDSGGWAVIYRTRDDVPVSPLYPHPPTPEIQYAEYSGELNFIWDGNLNFKAIRMAEPGIYRFAIAGYKNLKRAPKSEEIYMTEPRLIIRGNKLLDEKSKFTLYSDEFEIK